MENPSIKDGNIIWLRKKKGGKGRAEERGLQNREISEVSLVDGEQQVEADVDLHRNRREIQGRTSFVEREETKNK